MPKFDADYLEKSLMPLMRRLVGLARTRLGGRLKGKVDPESVVQSALGSLLAGMDGGQLIVNDEEELWKLLSTIVVRKVSRRFAYHFADKRSVTREQPLEIANGEVVANEAVVRTCCPEVDIEIEEEIEQFLVKMKPDRQRMIHLALEGQTVQEIAQQVERSPELVRLVLRGAREKLQKRLLSSD